MLGLRANTVGLHSFIHPTSAGGGKQVMQSDTQSGIPQSAKTEDMRFITVQINIHLDRKMSASQGLQNIVCFAHSISLQKLNCYKTQLSKQRLRTAIKWIKTTSGMMWTHALQRVNRMYIQLGHTKMVHKYNQDILNSNFLV